MRNKNTKLVCGNTMCQVILVMRELSYYLFYYPGVFFSDFERFVSSEMFCLLITTWVEGKKKRRWELGRLRQ